MKNRDLELRRLELVNDAEMPVTTDYIARALPSAWGTARALLLGLACQGKIQAIKTMKSWVFWDSRLSVETLKESGLQPRGRSGELV